MNKVLRTIAATLFSASALTSAAQTARVQAIHNCPDPAAATVDVYLNNMLILDNFNYKEASPYIDAPAGVNVDLSICAPTSVDTVGAIYTKTFNLMANEAYVVVAQGGLAEMGATAFDLFAYAGQELATNQTQSEVSVNIIHGAYDAPMVDIDEVSVPAGEIAPDLSFGDDNGYLDLGAMDYDVQIQAQTGEAVAEFGAPLAAFFDSAVVVLATGYLDPGSAVGTEPFGLIAVFPDGTVVPLSSQNITPARLQVIHNCAATDAATVDVWLDNAALIDDFEFRTASAFIDAPAGAFFDVSIAGPTSTDTVGALYRETFILESNRTYIVVASGTVGSGTYSPATPFSLEVITQAQETSMNTGEVDILVWHGATDAPAVDVDELTVPVTGLVTGLSYAESAGYLQLAEMDYVLDVKAAGGPSVAQFAAPLQSLSLAGNAITVLASGFLDPSMNNNGAAFGLWVALPTGGALVELPNVTGVEEEANIEFAMYPNPANNILNVQLEGNTNAQVIITDLSGKTVMTRTMLNSTENIDISGLANGYYAVTIFNDEFTTTKKLEVVR